MIYTFLGFFYNTATPPAKASGLTVTYAVYNAAQNLGAAALASGSAVESAIPGTYRASADLPEGNYVCLFHTDSANVSAADVAVADPFVSLETDLDTIYSAVLGLSGGGTYTVTVTTTPGARVAAKSGGTLIAKVDVDGGGTATLYLDAGTYDFIGTMSGYTITPLLAQAISGDAAITLTATPYAIAPPADPFLCRVYVYLNNHDNTHPANMPENQLLVLADPSGTVEYTSAANTGVYDSATGLLYWDVPQGATVRITVTHFVSITKMLVPDDATYDLGTR